MGKGKSNKATSATATTKMTTNAAVGEAAALPASPKRSKKRVHNRRETADFSSINALLDDSAFSDTGDGSAGANPASGDGAGTAQSDGGKEFESDASSSSPYRQAGNNDGGDGGGAVAEGDGNVEGDDSGRDDETADFSALFALGEMGMSPPPQPRPAAAAVVGDGAGAYPRARHHSNQKPSRGGKVPRVVPPPSVPSRGAARGGDGGGGGKGLSRPVSAKPKSPARRPRRSINLDPARAPVASWDDYAVPTPEPVRGGGGGCFCIVWVVCCKFHGGFCCGGTLSCRVGKRGGRFPCDFAMLGVEYARDTLYVGHTSTKR